MGRFPEDCQSTTLQPGQGCKLASQQAPSLGRSSSCLVMAWKTTERKSPSSHLDQRHTSPTPTRPPRTGRQAAPECLCGERCVSCPGAACLQSRERRAEGWVQVPLNRRRGSQADPMASCQVSRADRRSIPVVMAQELFSPASISVAHTISLAPLDLSRGSAPAIAPPK